MEVRPGKGLDFVHKTDPKRDQKTGTWQEKKQRKLKKTQKQGKTKEKKNLRKQGNHNKCVLSLSSPIKLRKKRKEKKERKKNKRKGEKAVF